LTVAGHGARRWPVTLAALLTGYGNAVGALQPPGWVAVPLNLSLSGGLLAAARRNGLSWMELGLARARLGAGLRVGLGATAVVAVALSLASAVPAAAPLLRDKRLAGWDLPAVAGHVFVRIPFGTVALEEVGFRGVLLAAFARDWSTGAAVVGSSAMFGLWHITPTLATLRANAPDASPLAAVLVVSAGVAVTAVGGGVFSLLRLRSGSLAAPFIAHTATNVLGTLSAVAALKL
jgi:uncharacterized protein